MLYPVLLVAYRDKALLRIKKHLPETKFWEVFYPCESESPRMGGGGGGRGEGVSKEICGTARLPV